MPFSRQQIDAYQVQTREVAVLGDSVICRGLSAGGRIRYKEALMKVTPTGKIELRENIEGAALILLHEGLLNADKSRMFGPDEFEAVKALPREIADAAIPVIRELSGMDKEDEAELEKKSANPPTDSQPTLSPSESEG